MAALGAPLAPARCTGVALMVTGRGFLAVDTHLRLPFLLPERVAGGLEAHNDAPARIGIGDLWAGFLAGGAPFLRLLPDEDLRGLRPLPWGDLFHTRKVGTHVGCVPLRVDGFFTFQATLQSDVHTIKRCMTQMGYRFDY